MDGDKEIAVYERIGSLEERCKSFNRRIENLEDDNKGFHKLAILIEQQANLIEQQIIINQKQNDTLENVNENLTKLNYKFDTIENRVDDLEKINTIRETTKKETKNNILTKIIYPIVSGLILLALGIWLNLK